MNNFLHKLPEGKSRVEVLQVNESQAATRSFFVIQTLTDNSQYLDQELIDSYLD